MSGEPYSQKSGLKNHSNERIFQVMTLKNVFTPLYYLQWQILLSDYIVIGDWERIVVASLKWSPPPLNIL